MGIDPVTGQVVRSGELIKATPVEVAESLKQYNELDGEDESGKGEGGVDNTVGAAAERPVAHAAFGSVEGRDHKNSEGRARDTAPVASTGAGPHRQSGGLRQAG